MHSVSAACNAIRAIGSLADASAAWHSEDHRTAPLSAAGRSWEAMQSGRTAAEVLDGTSSRTCPRRPRSCATTSARYGARSKPGRSPPYGQASARASPRHGYGHKRGSATVMRQRPDKRSGPDTTPGRSQAADSTTSTVSVHGGELVDLAAWPAAPGLARRARPPRPARLVLLLGAATPAPGQCHERRAARPGARLRRGWLAGVPELPAERGSLPSRPAGRSECKAPVTTRGFKDAISDPGVIRGWWRRVA